MVRSLSGKNAFELRLIKRRVIDEFVNKHGDFGLENIDCSSVEADRVHQALTAYNFLAPQKLVLLNGPSKNKELGEKLPDWLEAVSGQEGTDLDVLIVEPDIDRRSGFFKFLQKSTDFTDCPELPPNALPKWLSQEAGKRGGNLKLADANYLVERVGSNQLMLSNELDKLLTYDTSISRDSIKLLTEPNPQSTIFELIDAAIAGNTKVALQLYDEQRRQKVEPQQIIAMLAWQLHVLSVIKAASLGEGSPNPELIAKTSGLNPFIVRKNLGIARQLGLNELKDLVSRTLKLDINLKSINIDADDALQHLIMTI